MLSSITTQLLSFLQASDAPSNVLSKELLLQYFSVSLTNLITSVSEILRSDDFRQTFLNVFNRLIANMNNLQLSIVFVPLSDSSVKSSLPNCAGGLPDILSAKASIAYLYEPFYQYPNGTKMNLK